MALSRRIGVLAAITGLSLIVIMASGCAEMMKKERSSDAEPTETARARGSEPAYFDFDDVLVPSELEVDQKKSFLYRAGDFKAGVLVLDGRVDVKSLTKFFENNMAKDNWRMVIAFESPRTIMYFNKANRGCIINITETTLSTEVEIWVAPTIEETEEALLK
jgi:hypothetical protein